MNAAEAAADYRQTAWQEYLDSEHRARHGYLNVVERAHREYLTGAWPDRDAYEIVERQAWLTYYAAGRDAWRTYRAALEIPPPPPPAAANPAGQPHAGGVGWPAVPYEHPYPAFHPNPEGRQ